MEAAVAVLAVVLVLVLIMLWRSIVRVPSHQAAVIERGGRFQTVAKHGMTMVVPFLDRVRARVDLREQTLSYPTQTVLAGDGPLAVKPTLHFEVADPQKAVYEVPSYLAAVEQQGKQTLHATAARLTRQEAASGALAEQIEWQLNQQSGRYGVRVTKISIAFE